MSTRAIQRPVKISAPYRSGSFTSATGAARWAAKGKVRSARANLLDAQRALKAAPRPMPQLLRDIETTIQRLDDLVAALDSSIKDQAR